MGGGIAYSYFINDVSVLPITPLEFYLKLPKVRLFWKLNLPSPYLTLSGTFIAKSFLSMI